MDHERDALARLEYMVDEVYRALRNLGGQSHLDSIYKEVGRICGEKGRIIPDDEKSFQSIIRGTLQAFCPECPRYRKARKPPAKLFRMMDRRERGWWGIRPGAEWPYSN